MDYTTDYNLNNQGWTLVSDGKRNVGIQFDNQGEILVHVGAVEPDSLQAPSILLSSNMQKVPSTFGLGGLPEDAKVYVRASGSTVVRVTVLAY